MFTDKTGEYSIKTLWDVTDDLPIREIPVQKLMKNMDSTDWEIASTPVYNCFGQITNTLPYELSLTHLTDIRNMKREFKLAI